MEHWQFVSVMRAKSQAEEGHVILLLSLPLPVVTAHPQACRTLLLPPACCSVLPLAGRGCWGGW